MTKAIASYPKDLQAKVVASRLENETGGLGYLSAQDAQEGALRRELIEKGLIKPQTEGETS